MIFPNSFDSLSSTYERNTLCTDKTSFTAEEREETQQRVAQQQSTQLQSEDGHWHILNAAEILRPLDEFCKEITRLAAALEASEVEYLDHAERLEMLEFQRKSRHNTFLPRFLMVGKAFDEAFMVRLKAARENSKARFQRERADILETFLATTQHENFQSFADLLQKKLHPQKELGKNAFPFQNFPSCFSPVLLLHNLLFRSWQTR